LSLGGIISEKDIQETWAQKMGWTEFVRKKKFDVKCLTLTNIMATYLKR